MGLFDFFTKEGKLKRHVRRMSDRDTPPEDRDASARWLFEDRSPKAVYGLITRFDLSLSQTVKDRAEKQQVYDMLMQIGQDAVAPLHAWLEVCRHYAWPLKLLEALAGEQAALDAVFGLLKGEAGTSSFHPEKKKELLVWLAERRSAGALAIAARFTEDFDEDVRYAAAEVLIGQGDDSARTPLLAMLARPDEDSNRLRHRLCDVFRARGWSVAGTELPRLPAGFGVQGDRIVVAG